MNADMQSEENLSRHLRNFVDSDLSSHFGFALKEISTFSKVISQHLIIFKERFSLYFPL